MEGKIRVRLEPLGVEVEAARGETLRDLLFAHGLEFPCGGRGACKGCRVKILRGAAPAAPEELAALTAAEIAEGWRLGCRIRPQADITLDIAQWETVILSDDSTFEFTPAGGLGNRSRSRYHHAGGATAGPREWPRARRTDGAQPAGRLG